MTSASRDRNSIPASFNIFDRPVPCLQSPHIVWHIIICVGFNNTVVSDMFTGWELIYRDLFCMVSGIGTLWFLPVLFVCYAVLTIIAGTINAGHMQKYRYIYLITAFILLVVISIPLGTFYVNPDSLLLKMVTIISCFR